MELFIVAAFTEHIFGGNQAGVVLLDRTVEFPDAALMQQIAAELKHSETAFVKRIGSDLFGIRYFTPEGEVDLCGHATISAFTVLREEKSLQSGKYVAKTAAGEIPVTIESDCIWMGMVPGKLIKVLSDEEASALYQAYGLCMDDKPAMLQPCIVSTGLPDILLPVDNIDKLTHSVQNKEEVIRLSQRHQVVGVHMYYPELSAQITAQCRNFAPLYGIDEEAATGTSGLVCQSSQSEKRVRKRSLVITDRHSSFSMSQPDMDLRRLMGIRMVDPSAAGTKRNPLQYPLSVQPEPLQPIYMEFLQLPPAAWRKA